MYYNDSLDPKMEFCRLSIFTEFRQRLVEGNAEQLLLDKLLQRLRDLGLLNSHQRQRTDSTHILAAVRNLNRLETLGETFRAAREKSLLPTEHLIDTGYITAEHLVNSRTQYGVEIVGTVRSDPRKAGTESLKVCCFTI